MVRKNDQKTLSDGSKMSCAEPMCGIERKIERASASVILSFMSTGRSSGMG